MYNNNFNSLFDDFYDAFASTTSTRIPPVDVSEVKDSYLIDVELPGYKKEDVDISVDNHTLTIKTSETYNKSIEDETDDNEYLIKETKLKQTFKRSFGLPKDVDEEHIGAKYLNGVLTVTVPKLGKALPKTIQIEAD